MATTSAYDPIHEFRVRLTALERILGDPLSAAIILRESLPVASPARIAVLEVIGALLREQDAPGQLR